MCVVWALFPALLCVVIQRRGGNVANTRLFTAVCVWLWFLSEASICLSLWLHLRFGVCVCVWYVVSKRQSNLNPKIKGRGGSSLVLVPVLVAKQPGNIEPPAVHTSTDRGSTETDMQQKGLSLSSLEVKGEAGGRQVNPP